jgi:hypothetical protein
MWLRGRTAGIWAALIIIAAGSTGFAGGMLFKAERSEVLYKQYALNSANADTKRAHEYEERNCRPLLPAAREKCVNEQEYAAHQAEHDDRDLEAQQTTAVWTHYLGVAGVLGTAFGLLGVALVLFTFREQRKTSRAELRAYLTVEPGGINESRDGVHRVPLNFINNGQTPAYHIEHGGDFLIMTGDPRQFDPATHGRLGGLKPEDFTVSSDQILGPKANRFSYAYLDEKLSKDFWGKIQKKEAAIIHYGFVRYVDAFSRPQATNFAFYHWGELLSDADSKVCRFGNNAT